MFAVWFVFALLWFVQCVYVFRLMWVQRNSRSNAYTVGYLRGAVNGLSVTAVAFVIATIVMIVQGF
jgi:hypothetical protein